MSEESEDSLRIPEGDLTHSGSRSPSPPSDELEENILRKQAVEESILMKLVELQVYSQDLEYAVRRASTGQLREVGHLLAAGIAAIAELKNLTLNYIKRALD